MCTMISLSKCPVFTIIIVVTSLSVSSTESITENADIAIKLEMAEVKEELLQTRKILSNLIHRLASDADKTSFDKKHEVLRRSASDESPQGNDESYDDVLSSLSLHDILPLISSCRCKDGTDGTPGSSGAPGAPGQPGRDGRDGTPGSQGGTGSPGAPGLSGNMSSQLRGPQGAPGADGLPGPRGQPGEKGIRGSPGNSSDTGSSYIRWGRTTCAGDAELVYQGFAAGTYYWQSGGGTNYQCLVRDPEYNSYTSGGSRTLLSGVEYQSESLGIFPNQANHQNVPCALCYTQRAAVTMMPATRSCPDKWTKEYEGYLMTQHYTQTRTTFECVDEHPEYIYGQSADLNGALFYFVKTDCDGAGVTGHCPPYNSERQLTCVVCSR